LKELKCIFWIFLKHSFLFVTSIVIEYRISNYLFSNSVIFQRPKYQFKRDKK
jgi:hypothetical protein